MNKNIAVKPKAGCLNSVVEPIQIMKHETSIKHEGKGISHKMTPVCSCGWEGVGYTADNDYQHVNVKDQMTEHRLEHRKNCIKGEQ